MIKKINTTNKNLSLYINEESLLIYSSLSYSLYGFRGSDAVLFLLMEEFNSIALVKKELIKQGVDLESVSEGLLLRIDNILHGRDKDFEKTDKCNPIEQFGFDRVIQAANYRGRVYCLNGWYFSIVDELGVNEELVALGHLTSDKWSGKSISEIIIKSSYEVVVNDILIDKIPTKEHLVPYLYGLIRSIYCQKIDFLVTLHAASLHYNNRVLILPGSSGVGKSTLSLFLTDKGFKLFSDEFTVITKESMVLPIPLGVGVKEGSWKTASQFFSNILQWKTHRRYDNQKVKYILSDKISDKAHSVLNAIIVFPRYIQGSKSILKPIDMVEALSNIIQTQYYFWDIKDVNQIEQWLNLLSGCSIYRLDYSDLKEANNIIKKVMRDEKV